MEMFKKKNENGVSVIAQNELGSVLTKREPEKKTKDKKPEMTDEEYLAKHKKYADRSILKPEVDHSYMESMGVRLIILPGLNL